MTWKAKIEAINEEDGNLCDEILALEAKKDLLRVEMCAVVATEYPTTDTIEVISINHEDCCYRYNATVTIKTTFEDDEFVTETLESRIGREILKGDTDTHYCCGKLQVNPIGVAWAISAYERRNYFKILEAIQMYLDVEQISCGLCS